MFGFGRKRARQPKLGDRPYRDWHDYWGAVVQTLGFAAVIITIIITLRTNASNNADMANAIGGIEDIADAMSDQANAIAAERPAVESQAKSAADSAAAAKATALLAKEHAGVGG
jgi:hypothetical protein